MNRHFFLAGILVMLLAACNSELLQVPAAPSESRSPVFHAVIETPDPDTKVYADENLKVLWNADDRIAIFDKYTYGFEHRFNGADGATAGSFTQVPNDDFVTGNTLTYVYAVYPYDERLSISNRGVLSLTLPSTQSYRENSFGLKANAMVSVSEDNHLSFRNLGGFLALKLYGTGITVKRIVITGNKGEKLAGAATVSASVGSMPTLTMKTNATGSVTLDCGSGVSIGSSAGSYTTFWLVLPPTSFTGGFTITVEDVLGGTFEKKTTKSVTITRNRLSAMAPVEVNPIY